MMTNRDNGLLACGMNAWAKRFCKLNMLPAAVLLQACPICNSYNSVDVCLTLYSSAGR